MTRLNKSIKEQIVKNAIDTAGITEQFAQLRTRRAKLAEDIRVDFLGGEDGIKAIEDAVNKVNEIKESIKSLSSFKGGFDVYIRESCRIEYINLGGMRTVLQYNGDLRIGDSEHKDKVRRSPTPAYGEVAYPADHRFTKEFLSIEGDYKALCDKKSGLYHQVMATLNQFTTIKKLLESCPEVKDLLPKEQAAKPSLPVVQVKDLNCLIGLPK